MTRSVWVDQGSDPWYGILQKHSITSCAFDIRDPRLTPAYLDGVKAKGLQPRFYACWNWPEVEQCNGGEFAEWVHRQMLRIGWGGNAPVDLNDETHSTGRIAALLQRWRQLRPTRPTLWTCEAHQSDFFLPIATAIRQANVSVGPQCYVNDMERVESAYEVRAWTRIVPLERIQPFLDASQLGHWWDDATAYTQGRLPQ